MLQQFDSKKFAVKPAASIVLLFSLFIFLMVATGMITTFLFGKMTNVAAAYRISAVLQSVLVFITPALAVAMLSTRFPASLLAVDRLPSLKFTLTAIFTLVVSIPLMNIIINWNQNLTFPESMSGIVQTFKDLEAKSEDSINIMTSGNSAGILIVNIMIIGIFAGLGEEIFFRAGLMRLLGGVKSIGTHKAIWISAIIFSALHLQFFGFVPRMLLGVFFGYLLAWSGSLWLPILMHIINNSIIVTFEWINQTNGTDIDINSIGTGSSTSDIIILTLSIVLTAFSLFMLYKFSKQTVLKNKIQ